MSLLQAIRNIDADTGDRNEILVFRESVDLGSVAANAVEDEAITVTGVRSSDIVLAVKPAASIGVIVGAAWVSAADEITAQCANPTASPVDESAANWDFIVLRG